MATNEGAEILPPDPPSEPVPDILREPVLADTDVDVQTPNPEDLVKDDESIRDAVQDASLERQEGGENFDVYSIDGAEHYAAVYPWPVNYEALNGDWKDLTPHLADSADGWTGEADGASITFPTELSSKSGVRYAVAEGSLTITPENVQSAGVHDSGNSVVYPDVEKETEYRYTLAQEGYKEEITWLTPDAPPALSWSLRSEQFTFSLTDAGEVAILSGGIEIATLPAPVVRDSSPELAETVAAYTLNDSGDGSQLLTATVDAKFLAEAAYPVRIDPQPQHTDKPAERDTYVSQVNAGSSFESDGMLRVSGNSNAQRRAYLRFDIAGLQRDERLVYDAALYLAMKQVNNTGDIAARRVDDNQGWPQTMTWNNKPALGMEMDPGQEQDGPWRFWELENLYQHYIRTAYSDHWADQGVALESAGGSLDFWAKENTHFSDDSGDPRLYLAWNDLPNPPQSLTAPDQAATIDSPSPTLKIGDVPNDFNGDKVLVRFQIDENSDWDGDAIEYTSPWQKEERSHVVPGGVLTDGQTYYWRAQSKDVFPLMDGSNVQRTPPTSTDTRHFKVVLRHYGEDERWAMWSRTLGNGMNMKVNEANGNLFLDVPLDTVSTPLDDVEIGLSYNSLLRDRQASANPPNEYGMGPGWDLSVGPVSAGKQLPIELEKIPPQPDGGVKIRMRGGALNYFPHRDGRVYAAVGSSAEVRRDAKGNFVYKDEHGGRFFFSSTGKLEDAAPAWTKGAANNARLHYTYNTDSRLTKVADPIGREIRFFWNDQPTPRLDHVKLWDGIDNRIWDFTYSGNKLTTIQTPVTQPGTAVRETITFVYNATTGRLIEVQDGELTARAEEAWDGWKVKYWQDPLGYWRVDRITPPGGVEPSTDPAVDGDFWDFDYPTSAGDYRETTAAWARIIDPRGEPAGEEYLTTVDFNWAGLPIRIEDPAGADSYRPQTTMVWDSNNNMICRRSPAANAVAAAELPDKSDTAENHVCKTDSLNEVYEYETQEPYRMMRITHPAPSEGASEDERQVETFNYDQGDDSFKGLWAELYENQHLEGFPKTERMWTDFDKSWQDGNPTGIDVHNNWSFRLTGYLDLRSETQEKDYEFKVLSDDGVAVTIGDKSIVDCFGEANDYGEVNCDGRQIVEKTLFPGLKPITIEFSDIVGNARFTLKWDKGLDEGANNPLNFSPLTDNFVRANLGLLTQKTVTIGEDLTKEISYDYDTDDAKARELMRSETVSHAEGMDSRTTAYDYNQYGQVTRITTPSSVTVNAYTNAPSPSTWVEEPNVPTSCMRSIIVWPPNEVDHEGEEVSKVERECDAAGRVRREVVRINAIEDQPAQDRITTTTYDALGRVSSVNAGAPASAEEKLYTYDLSGRKTSESVLLDAGPSPDERALTEYEYFPTGTLRTERQPDPGNGGLQPTIHYTYDWADNQISRTDPRHSSWLWEAEYDGSNRVIEVESPLGLRTSTEYVLVNDQEAYDHKTVTTTPNGVSGTTRFDILGRKIEERAGTNNVSTQLRPTEYEYDLAGNVVQTRLDLPGPAVDDVETTTEYNVFGQVEKEVKFSTAAVGKRATTDNHYNAAGQLDWVDGPRTDVNDKVLYTYDAAGRITKATYDGVALPNSSTKVSTEVKYDMAGERVWMKTPLTTSIDMVRDWTYDEFGRVATSREHPGVAQRPDRVTTYVYNDAGWLLEQETHEESQNPARTLKFEYDDLGRITRRYATPSAPTNVEETYSFDALYGAGPGGTKNVSANGVATITQWVDKDGRVWKVSDGTEITQTTFDPAGQVESIQDAAGTTTFKYDANLGLLDKFYDPLTCTASDPVADCDPVDYTYDAAGRVTGRSDPSGLGALEWTRGYEQSTGLTNSLTIVSGSADLVTSELEYDAAGNVVTKTQSIRDATNNTDNSTAMLDDTYTYAYDGASRMVNADGPGPATTYVYDGLGDRISSTRSGTTETVTYDGAAQPRTSDEGTPANTADDTKYEVDVYGNLVGLDRGTGSSQEDWEFRYDAWGRMYEAEGDDLIEYMVDPLNRVRQRIVQGGAARTFHYRAGSEDPAKTMTGSVATTFAYSSGGPMAQKAGSSSPQTFMSDLHGDVVGLVNASGIATGTRTVLPYGEQRQKTGTASTNFGFQGDWTDENSELVDMLSRYYLPELGRFTTPDLLFGDVGDPMSLNQFGYVKGNPVSLSDPTGMVCSGPDPTANNCGTWEPPPPGGGKGSGSSPSGSSSGSSSGTSSVAEPPQPVAAPPTYSLPQFRAMTMSQRSDWLSQFQEYYGTEGWFNSIQGVLRFLRDTPELQDPNGFASRVDARILVAIQDGMRIHRGIESGVTNPIDTSGAAEWSLFFDEFYRRGSERDPDALGSYKLKNLWATAEQAGTEAGVRDANEAGEGPSLREQAFFKITEAYRATGRGELGIGPQLAWDPTDGQSVYVSAHVVWERTGSAGLPSGGTLLPVL